jgi:hypothetical protein
MDSVLIRLYSKSFFYSGLHVRSVAGRGSFTQIVRIEGGVRNGIIEIRVAKLEPIKMIVIIAMIGDDPFCSIFDYDI